jgi:polysaccharide export outer membrane protein
MYTVKGSNAAIGGWVLAAIVAYTAAVGQEQSSDDYVIGPGDTLNIFVWREPDFSTTLPVRPDGRISTPLVEDMVAVGKTPSQLARDVEQVLAEFLRNPQVTVMVEDFVGTFKSQVRVLGEVASPGSYPYRDGMTLLDALTEAGGLTEFAAGRRGLLRRSVDGKQEELRVRIDRLMKEGDLDQNRSLLPGDVIVVPEAVF